MEANVCYLFVGNPGTGKSTLINGLIGKPIFKAGTSLNGSGITYQFDKKVIPGLGVVMDTPGLGDTQKKHMAAAAITEALKQNGFYRIFFVMTEESGRIRPSDKATMRLVLDAAPTITDYSVIVNKVEAEWLNELQADPRQAKEWITELMSGLPTLTANVTFMTRMDILAGKKDVAYSAPIEILNFIQSAPGMAIKSTDVNDVVADEYDKLVQEHQALLERLEKDKAEMQRYMDEQQEEMELALARAQQAAEEASAEAGRRAKEAEERAERCATEAAEAVDKASEEMASLVKQAEEARKVAEDARKEAQSRKQGGENMFARVLTGIVTLGISEAFR